MAMNLTLAETISGSEVLLTDEHPICELARVPVVAVGRGPGARILGKADRIQTSKGLFDAGRLILDWIESQPLTPTPQKTVAVKYLADAPDFL